MFLFLQGIDCSVSSRMCPFIFTFLRIQQSKSECRFKEAIIFNYAGYMFLNLFDARNWLAITIPEWSGAVFHILDWNLLSLLAHPVQILYPTFSDAFF